MLLNFSDQWELELQCWLWPLALETAPLERFSRLSQIFIKGQASEKGIFQRQVTFECFFGSCTLCGKISFCLSGTPFGTLPLSYWLDNIWTGWCQWRCNRDHWFNLKSQNKDHKTFKGERNFFFVIEEVSSAPILSAALSQKGYSWYDCLFWFFGSLLFVSLIHWREPLTLARSPSSLHCETCSCQQPPKNYI